MKKKWVGFYDYTVVLTYCGMLSAVAGFFCAITSRFTLSLVHLMISGVCDMFDGAVASTKKRTADEKRFGIQIDSLSDLISFGVLPGIFTFCISPRNRLMTAVSMFFILCALIRLSYFNVMEENRQQETDECRKSFTGMPVTTIALLLPFIYILQYRNVFSYTYSYAILLVICGILFLAPITVPKPQKTGKAIVGLIGIMVLIQMLMLV